MLRLTLLSLYLSASLFAVDYKLEPLQEPAPTGDLSAELAAELAPTGVRVLRGESTKFCDIWLRKTWPAIAGFKATPEVGYPFQPGLFIGVVRFGRKGSDFRNQDIKSGLYTLRYGQQPVDGNHVGTSPTRDFVLLIGAAADQKLELLDYKTMTKLSADSAGSAHPLLLNLRKSLTEAPAAASLAHDEEHDWWTAALPGRPSGDGAKPLALELVVVGVAKE